MIRSLLTAALFLLLGREYLLAQDPAGTSQPQPPAVSYTPGKQQFQQLCGFCHGPDARGANGPDLIRSSIVSHDLNGDLIGPVIRNGRPEKGMPAFQLSEIQIRELAGFLHSEAHLASSVTQREFEYPLDKLLIGSAPAGRDYFNGTGQCAKCHSTTGDFAHIASKYKPIDLQTRIAFPSGAMPNVTVTDRSGHTFTGAETYSDEFTISLRDRNGWVRGWNRRTVKVQADDPLAAHVALLNQYTDKDIHDLLAYLVTLK